MKRKVTRFAKVEKRSNKINMNEYLVYVHEISGGRVNVRAENEKEAEEKAINAVMNGDTFWGDSETVVEEVKLVERVLPEPDEDEG